MNIGDWIARERGPGKAHIVESIVNGDAVVHCGKTLTNEPTKSGGRLIGYAIRSVCKACQGPAT